MRPCHDASYLLVPWYSFTFTLIFIVTWIMMCSLSLESGVVITLLERRAGGGWYIASLIIRLAIYYDRTFVRYYSARALGPGDELSPLFSATLTSTSLDPLCPFFDLNHLRNGVFVREVTIYRPHEPECELLYVDEPVSGVLCLFLSLSGVFVSTCTSFGVKGG